MNIFSFGYYGWGSYTPQLLTTVDAVEACRGFQPPLFVDIRFRRAVRATGFTGSAFEKLLGQNRYRWMKSLGNKRIETRTGPPIQIAEPETVDELLNLAIESAKNKQRLLFFCSCQVPCCEGRANCHRSTVAKLLVNAARHREIEIGVEEWPGGLNEPRHVDIELPSKDFDAVSAGKMLIPLRNPFDLTAMASLPWCSTATLRSGQRVIHRLVGPLAHRSYGWVLPVTCLFHDQSTTLEAYQREQLVDQANWTTIPRHG